MRWHTANRRRKSKELKATLWFNGREGMILWIDGFDKYTDTGEELRSYWGGGALFSKASLRL